MSGWFAPLSSVSLAKYTYCEADPVRLGHVWLERDESARLINKMRATLGGKIAGNHVGKLYDAIVGTLGELKDVMEIQLALAQAMTMGPLHSIACYLPTKGSAVPFFQYWCSPRRWLYLGLSCTNASIPQR